MHYLHGQFTHISGFLIIRVTVAMIHVEKFREIYLIIQLMSHYIYLTSVVG